MNLSLSWRAENAFIHAWPALRESERSGWRLRFSPGTDSRRINSANPLSESASLTPDDRIAIEATFRAAGTTPLFRVPYFLADSADAELTRAGYTTESETSTLFAALDRTRYTHGGEISVSETQHPRWLEGLADLRAGIGKQNDAMGQVFARLNTPCIFAGAWREGCLVSAAFGARHDDLVCIEAVVTAPEWRRHGLARAVVSAILERAAVRGAQSACLQVEVTNSHAIALYKSLGFNTELYRYHYRRAPKQA